VRPLRDYVAYVIVMAPLLNSVSGIAIDLFAPSMPSIGRAFGVSNEVMQGSISITLVAYAVGQLFFGLVADGRGRLAALLPGLGLFVAASLLAMLAQNIETFLLARALQGFAVGACQVCARALLVDNVKGEQFFIAVVYLSLAWGLGPVVAPFLGGLVEQYAGWRWNFALYAAYSTALLLLSLRLRESLAPAHRKSLGQSLYGYRIILGNRRFLCGTLTLGASLSMFLVWNVIGPFLAHLMNKSPSWFGATALAAGLAYLLATLLNRALIRRCSVRALMISGLLIGGLGIGVMLLTPNSLGLLTLLAGVVLCNFGQGLLFSNVFAYTMKLYPDRAGATASLLGCGIMVCAGFSSSLTGQLLIADNAVVALLFAALLGVQVFGVYTLLRPQRLTEDSDHEHQVNL
jgi:MFS family permease